VGEKGQDKERLQLHEKGKKKRGEGGGGGKKRN